MILLISRWHGYHSYGVWNLITYGIPLVTLSMLVVGAFHLGLIGREYPDGLREWWSRLGGEILGIAVCWFLFSIVTLFVPIWLEHVRLYVPYEWPTNMEGSQRTGNYRSGDRVDRRHSERPVKREEWRHRTAIWVGAAG